MTTHQNMTWSMVEKRVNDLTTDRSSQIDGVVCFAGVDWWYHNRGHSECQIMRRLARKLPVLWINSIGMRLPTPGKSSLVLRRFARKLRSTFRGMRRDDSGLWVYSPLFLPRYTRTATALNGILLDWQVRVLTRWLGISNPCVWVTIPTAVVAVERGRWERIVFNRSDAFSSFPEVDTEVIKQFEEKLLRRSDDVLYVSRDLMEQERGRCRRAHLVPHGVDFDHFASARSTDGPTMPAPARIATLPKPIVGFYGALDDYTIDLELMIRIARSIPEGTLLVIGPRAMEIGRLLAEPNVVYLGPIPYEELPAYAAHFDVGIMPWLRNEWIAKCNPIKLREYLALGFPIVSIQFPELADYEEHVYAAADHEEFLQQLRHALEERSPERSKARRASVLDESWDSRTSQVSRILGLEST